MNAKRSKKVRLAAKLILSNPEMKEAVDRAASDKLDMPNRYGADQHRRINTNRLLKKMVIREKIA